MRYRTLLLAPLLVATACGDDDPAGDTITTAPTDDASAADDATAADADDAADVTSAVTLVSPRDAAALIADAPDDLVVLDVRTPEEFAEGHVDGAVLVDFYEPDFADRIAELDPDASYVVYCRSGNRSGQAVALMDDLGFAAVNDVDGGVLAWADAGLPLVTP